MDRQFDSTIGELVVTALERGPGRTAFVNPDGRRVSRRRVAQEIRHAGDRLSALGVGRGASVAQLSGNRAEIFSAMAACYLGGQRSGALSPTVDL